MNGGDTSPRCRADATEIPRNYRNMDWYGITYYGRRPESDPKGPLSGEYRVSRGGSFGGGVRGQARVSSRYIQKPNVRSIVIGFRCVRELTP